MVMGITISSRENCAIDIRSEKNPSYLECANDLGPQSEDPSKLQVLLNRLNGSVGMPGMHFAPAKFKILL